MTLPQQCLTTNFPCLLCIFSTRDLLASKNNSRNIAGLMKPPPLYAKSAPQITASLFGWIIFSSSAFCFSTRNRVALSIKSLLLIRAIRPFSIPPSSTMPISPPEGPMMNLRSAKWPMTRSRISQERSSSPVGSPVTMPFSTSSACASGS